jgi:predicted ATPase
MSKGVFGRALAKQMFNYFTAFITEEATGDDREKLLGGFIDLCNEAYNLRLSMRKSRSNYQCLNVATGALEESTERYADVFGELEGTGNGRTTVLLTLFGGLGVQIRDSGETRFLEKAQIIVTRA